ncbi:hypothetical protein TDB9533_02425 [Thalassocella blandensis]|nr:hypothetical protein TDB9533_02425 [Thalassocella blandensis]
MRRADRLFQIIQILRNRRTVTAKFLAERLEVSERTIYRDIQDLSLSGVPIEGEAGVGYMLRHSLDIPPLMFDQDEIQALVLGARMVETWGGKALAKGALSAIEKIESVIPRQLQHLTQRSHLYAYPFQFERTTLANMDVLREAINAKRCIQFDYRKEDGERSQRCIQPLALYFWGQVWTLTSWCRLRRDFRNFRIDRMTAIHMLEEVFIDEAGKTLDDYIQQITQRWDCDENPS